MSQPRYNYGAGFKCHGGEISSPCISCKVAVVMSILFMPYPHCSISVSLRRHASMGQVS